MRISDWSSDVCSSDLRVERLDALADVDRGQQRQRLAVVLSLAPVQRIPAPAVRRAHFGGFGVVERAVAQPRQQLLALAVFGQGGEFVVEADRKSTRLNSSH